MLRSEIDRRLGEGASYAARAELAIIIRVD